MRGAVPPPPMTLHGVVISQITGTPLPLPVPLLLPLPLHFTFYLYLLYTAVITAK